MIACSSSWIVWLTCMLSASMAFAGGEKSTEWNPWSRLRFEALHPIVVETSVEQILDALEREGSSPCTAPARVQPRWDCIVAILQRLAEVEAEFFAEGQVEPQLTHTGLFALQMRHGGRLWSFWYGVASLKTVSEQVGGEAVFTAEFRNVLRDMEVSFRAALAPVTSDSD
jgi:hypothetical protein